MSANIPCAYCNIIFSDVNAYWEHLPLTHEIPVPSCNQCQISFVMYDELKTHMHRVHRVRRLGRDYRQLVVHEREAMSNSQTGLQSSLRPPYPRMRGSNRAMTANRAASTHRTAPVAHFESVQLKTAVEKAMREILPNLLKGYYSFYL